MPMKINYRKIWEKTFGSIPKDDEGRSFEIHHRDGNRTNNSIENLMCISIQEHYDIHYEQGDYGACVMIAKRMSLSPDHMSKIQIGVKRPGVGGVKKGTVPWNKGHTGYKLNFTEEGKIKRLEAVKKKSKIKDEDAKQIREEFENRMPINNDKIGKIMNNGRSMSYERAFCLEYSKKFNVSDQYIYRIIKGKVKIV